MEEKNKTVGLVFGILSLAFATISLFICWWLSIVGIVLGIIGISMGSSKALNIGGICLGSGSLILFVSLLMSL